MKEWVVIEKMGGGRFGREKGEQDLEYLTLNKKKLAVFHIVKEVFLKLNFVMF